MRECRTQHLFHTIHHLVCHAIYRSHYSRVISGKLVKRRANTMKKTENAVSETDMTDLKYTGFTIYDSC